MTSLIDNEISMKFSDNDTCYVYQSDTLMYSTKLHLSKNGKQIVLNFGCIPTDYIDLLVIGENSIKIGKSDMIQIGDIKSRYVVDYYKLKLSK